MGRKTEIINESRIVYYEFLGKGGDFSCDEPGVFRKLQVRGICRQNERVGKEEEEEDVIYVG